MATLLFFNPEHDYALANNDANYVAPQSALAFASDCAGFMSYLTDEKCSCLSMADNNLLMEKEDIDAVMVWGWDKAVQKRLRKMGLSASLFPDDAALNRLRLLAHRQISSQALHYLQNHFLLEGKPLLPYPLPPSAIPITSFSDLEKLWAEKEKTDNTTQSPRAILLKRPYSGNGTGIIRLESLPTQRLFKHQELWLAEPEYKVIQNVAMEFYCDQHQTLYCGYSLFNTQHFSYSENILLSEERIEQRLNRWIDSESLHRIRERLIQFFNEQVAPFYQGYLGVDMFIYQEDGQYKLHPMVEINLRCTMGLAAVRIFNRYVHPHSQGTMKIHHDERPQGLLDWATEQSLRYPLRCLEGKWISGFKSLTQIGPNSRYAVCVNLSERE